MAQAKTLNQSEIDMVLRYINTKQKYSIRNRAMLLTSYWSGMRVGEIAALRICDVRNEDNTIKSEIRLSASQTKGNKGRVVFVNEKLRTELAAYLRYYSPKDTSLPLFATEKSKGFSANTLTQWFFWLYRKAGVSGASSHSGRRTYATNLASNGVGIKVLQNLMGHKDIQTTSIYIFSSDDMMRKAVELV